MHNPQAVDCNVLGGFALNLGNRFGGAAGCACTELYHRAHGAQWIVFLANRGAELHHRLVVVAGSAVVEYLIGERGEGFDRRAVVFERARVVGQAGEYTDHIAVDHRGRVVLCNGADGCGGVGAYAWQRLPLLGIGWLCFQCDVGLCEFVEIACTAVVAEAFPVLEDVLAGGCGECLEVGEALHPAGEIRQHGFDLCLLCHQLGYHGTVQAGLRAPGQWSLGSRKPCGERRLKRFRLGEERHFGKTSNIARARSNLECWQMSCADRALL